MYDSHQLFANFWWGSAKRKNKRHWFEWTRMCVPKGEGGLGFRDIPLFNQALLAKQIWRILKNLDSLVFKVLRQKYFV